MDDVDDGRIRTAYSGGLCEVVPRLPPTSGSDMSDFEMVSETRENPDSIVRWPST